MLSVLRRNLSLKIFSFVLAVALWLVISRGSGVEEMEMSLGIPLELHNLPADMEVVRGPVETVNIRFSGPRRTVLKISQMGLSVPLDLAGAAEGETTFELYPSNFKAPEKVTVTRISPSSVVVGLEKVVRLTLPVKADIQGRPAKGFKVGDVTVKPEGVSVLGPRSVVRSLRTVATEPVSIDGAQEDLELDVGIILSGEALRIEGDQTVHVLIPIRSTGEK
ncbi:MAG: hypothetical protein JSV26_05240 [bacterium]|nr:MAG: hypothetical protein JSV26_05240 [bacterium]